MVPEIALSVAQKVATAKNQDSPGFASVNNQELTANCHCRDCNSSVIDSADQYAEKKSR